MTHDELIALAQSWCSPSTTVRSTVDGFMVHLFLCHSPTQPLRLDEHERNIVGFNVRKKLDAVTGLTVWSARRE